MKYTDKAENNVVWTVESIKRDQAALVEFVEDTWNPNKYYQPKNEISNEEYQDMVDEIDLT